MFEPIQHQALTMTTPAAQPSPAPPPPAKQPREQLTVTSAIDLLDTAKFEHMQRVATLMSKMELLPVHLRARPWFYPKKKTENLAPAEEKKWRDELGPEAFDRAWAQADQRTVANCILVVNQALRWGMDPLITMGETYEIGGKLANQGKLILAVVNARAGLKGRLRFEFSGDHHVNPKNSERAVTVIGTFKDEDVARTIDLKVKDAATGNEMWVKDPDQKLIYTGVTKWARRHCPEVILGVITDDDDERMIEEASAARVATAPSQLDAFASAGALPPGPSPSQVIDITGTGSAQDPIQVAAQPTAATAASAGVAGPGSDDQAGTAPSAQVEPSALAGQAVGGSLSPAQVVELKAAIGRAGLSLDAVEGHYGASLADITIKGLDSKGVEADVITTIKSMVAASKAAAAPVFLSASKVGMLRSLMAEKPAVDEAVVVSSLGQDSGGLEVLASNPGETAQALYTRVLAEIQRVKQKS